MCRILRTSIRYQRFLAGEIVCVHACVRVCVCVCEGGRRMGRACTDGQTCSILLCRCMKEGF